MTELRASPDSFGKFGFKKSRNRGHNEVPARFEQSAGHHVATSASVASSKSTEPQVEVPTPEPAELEVGVGHRPMDGVDLVANYQVVLLPKSVIAAAQGNEGAMNDVASESP